MTEDEISSNEVNSRPGFTKERHQHNNVLSLYFDPRPLYRSYLRTFLKSNSIRDRINILMIPDAAKKEKKYIVPDSFLDISWLSIQPLKHIL